MSPLITILQAAMTYSKEEGYVGKVEFQVQDHKLPYEMTLYSKSGRDWSYGLHFLNESGSEEQILEVEDLLEENDEWFDFLVDAAKSKLQS
ncbi:hypothetical protein N0M98_17630 [Paenibacillus doosanensis]|uniref:hypothetical protein n=1 Tax=Paenibacillus doosanensis TaxID=1229154 RepID=UPI002180766B|nr:hypothetical protein [Paenibacillus doosanensis]MCS7461961.1 hypothetical protein [Paenibacillus doosanensis]